MKTITFISSAKKNYHLGFLLFLAMLASTSYAQVQNNGTLFVANNGQFYLKSGNYAFGASPATSATTRTALTYGKVTYAAGTTNSGQSNAHFLNGYASTLSTSQFIFPIGQSSVYAPAAITATSTVGVDAAYYRAPASTVGITLDASVRAISADEYWDIKSASAAGRISLTWRSSSNIGTLTAFGAGTAISKLVIAGWDGTKWVQIPSTVDATSILGGTSDATAGSITSNFDVPLTTISNFRYFTLAAKGDCFPIVVSSGVTKTWNGAWTPSAPTIADPVVINTAYSGNLSCFSLVLNADITLADGQFVDIQNGTSGTGKIIMSSSASVVQRITGTAPLVELTKQTRSLRRTDYVYWGSPIVPAATTPFVDFTAQIDSARPVTALGNTTSAFDLKYTWTAGASAAWASLSAMPSPGNGFIMRVAPIAPYVNATFADAIRLRFAGRANTSDVPVTLALNAAASANSRTRYNFLANPYPSAIDGDMFLRLNAAIDGVLYVWQQATFQGNDLSTQTYSQADFITYTKVGSTAPTNNPVTFSGNIASGQGFFVRADIAGTATFTNCMRLTGNNNAFFRSTGENSVTAETLDKFKLTMTGEDGVYSQILIAYTPETTLGYDRMYDAVRNSTSTAQLYSILDADGRRLAIDARPNFTNADIVPLGVAKSSTANQIFTVNIEQKEGLFSTGQDVYLHDRLLQVYHNFANGAYVFTSNSASDNNRFEVVYRSAALGNSDLAGYSAVATINGEVLTVKATKEMEKIYVFDITGKQVCVYNAESNRDFSSGFIYAEGVYIAKIKLQSGEIVTQKLINSKN